ncbi:hypothetical protein KIM372_14000 [Bombiscardovia nodaiensis]|uniref:CopG family transcriptional regulator n=1 Tax=Bombiscardovia nodaiensis TaxID=2932181 RepID=A0ABM8BA83_9BIFI|nr:hypothetical protein KIM372_14000 [Bombiscardovia nodaiensis]
MSSYMSDDGTVISEEMIDKWAGEAERGFEGSQLQAVDGRPWEGRTEALKPRTIRVSDSLWDLVQKAAKTHHMSVSEYARQELARALSA